MIPVIMSGGSGTRLWPVSRAACPKQFVELLDRSLFALTLERLKPFGTPWCVTGRGLKVLTEREYRKLGMASETILFEPLPRNTAPAVAWACKVALDLGRGHEVMGVFPADQVVHKSDLFVEALRMAEVYAAKGEIVTIGITPTHAATGFGYIEIDTELRLDGSSTSSIAITSTRARRAVGFREKPTEAKATQYLQSGRFFWNAGIFVFKISRMVELFETHMPDLWEGVKRIPKLGHGNAASNSDFDEIFAGLPSQSLDYGVMEKLSSFVCVPGEFGWSDLGSWDELATFDKGTPFTAVDSHRNYVHGSTEKVYAMVGVDDLILVDTPDACLITKKGKSQDIRKVVEELSSRGAPQAREHLYDFRPWGRYEVLRDTEEFKSKLIEVEPNSQLSYQSHNKRAEHWIVVCGTAEVTLDGTVHRLGAGESIFIPVRAKHRVKNPGPGPLRFVEVQVGSYFGEDDIIRYSDDYGRT